MLEESAIKLCLVVLACRGGNKAGSEKLPLSQHPLGSLSLLPSPLSPIPSFALVSSLLGFFFYIYIQDIISLLCKTLYRRSKIHSAAVVLFTPCRSAWHQSRLTRPTALLLLRFFPILKTPSHHNIGWRMGERTENVNWEKAIPVHGRPALIAVFLSTQRVYLVAGWQLLARHSSFGRGFSVFSNPYHLPRSSITLLLSSTSFMILLAEHC